MTCGFLNIDWLSLSVTSEGSKPRHRGQKTEREGALIMLKAQDLIAVGNTTQGPLKRFQTRDYPRERSAEVFNNREVSVLGEQR